MVRTTSLSAAHSELRIVDAWGGSEYSIRPDLTASLPDTRPTHLALEARAESTELRRFAEFSHPLLTVDLSEMKTTVRVRPNDKNSMAWLASLGALAVGPVLAFHSEILQKLAEHAHSAAAWLSLAGMGMLGMVAEGGNKGDSGSKAPPEDFLPSRRDSNYESIFNEIAEIKNSQAPSYEKAKALSELRKGQALTNADLQALVEAVREVGSFEERLIPLGEVGSRPEITTPQLQFIINEIKAWYDVHAADGGAAFLALPVGLLSQNPNLTLEQIQDLVAFSLNSQQVPDAKAVTLEAFSIHPNTSADLFEYLASQMQRLNPKYFEASFVKSRHPYANHPRWALYLQKLAAQGGSESNESLAEQIVEQ